MLFWFLAFGQCVLIAWLLKCINVGHVATVAELFEISICYIRNTDIISIHS